MIYYKKSEHKFLNVRFLRFVLVKTNFKIGICFFGDVKVEIIFLLQNQ